MLARCVEQALGQERELEAAMRRGRPSSSGGSVAALEALLVRADREAKDGGAAVGSVFGLVVGAAGKAAKRKDFSRVGACGTLCRWLVSRGEARCGESRLTIGPGAARVVEAIRGSGGEAASSDGSRWRALGAAEVVRSCCAVAPQRGASPEPRAAAAAVAALRFAELGVLEALASLVRSADGAPTVAGLAGARALHEVVHGVAVGAGWRDAGAGADAGGRCPSAFEADSDDGSGSEDEAVHGGGGSFVGSMLPVGFGAACGEALVGRCLRPYAAVVHAQICWHKSSSGHRAAAQTAS